MVLGKYTVQQPSTIQFNKSTVQLNRIADQIWEIIFLNDFTDQTYCVVMTKFDKEIQCALLYVSFDYFVYMD